MVIPKKCRNCGTGTRTARWRRQNPQGNNPLPEYTTLQKYLHEAAPYIIIVTAIFIVYALVYGNTNFRITHGNAFNSYSIQAYRWLQGHLDLAYNYRHLEIALFDNRYWISFPPLPSVIMLPFVAILGSPNTPDHFIALAIFLMVAIYAYKIAYHQLGNRVYATFFALFLILGTNYLQIAMRGIVWHMAQNLGFMFTLMAIYYSITKNKRHSILALFLLCCAMGCRPLQGIYIPLIICLLYQRHGGAFFPFVKKLFLYSIPAIILGAGLLAFNYVRFGSIFEFGHNFLPASMAAPYGQFGVGYMANHLRVMFLRFPTQLPLITHYTLFQPIAIWIISPLVISYVVVLVKSKVTRWEKDDALRDIFLLLMPVLIVLHLLLLSAHKDVGGPQFGYRYTIDVLPVMFLGLVTLLGKAKCIDGIVSRNSGLFAFGFFINIIGLIDAIGVR